MVINPCSLNRLVGTYHPAREVVKRLPFNPTPEDIRKWYHLMLWSTPAAMVTDARSDMHRVFEDEVVKKLKSRKWRNEAFDMKPIPLGKGALLLPTLSLEMLQRSVINKAELHCIVISTLEEFLAFSDMKTNRLPWG